MEERGGACEVDEDREGLRRHPAGEEGEGKEKKEDPESVSGLTTAKDGLPERGVCRKGQDRHSRRSSAVMSEPYLSMALS